MERVNEFVFYELAIKVHAMAEFGMNPVKMSECWFQLWNARNSVDQIFSQRPLNFTSTAALRLYQAITTIIPQDWNALIAKLPKPGEPEEPILPWVATEIREAALDVPTAAAFHLLRGTEAMIRQYYELKVPGAKRATLKMRNWGVYLRLLKAYKGNAQVLSVLDHLRDAYRNPVTHPEENYTDERVQVLFGLCVSAVVLLVQAIAAEKPKGGTLNFPISTAIVVSTIE